MNTPMANLTLTIPEDLKKEIQKHKEVNWSAVTRKAMQEHLRKIHIANAIASKSKLTKKDIAELDKLVKKGIAKSHRL
jgi:post-segregation antitoxin (ccd killing protein)